MTEDMRALVQDLEQTPAAPPSGDGLRRLQELGQRVLNFDADIRNLDEEMKRRSQERHLLVSKHMPELMIQYGVDHVGVAGRTFRLEDFYHASIKKDAPNAAEAYDWLETNDAADIISYTVTTTFPKDSHEQAEALRRYVVERYQNASVTVERGVPWKRLTSWLKELFQRHRSGEEPGLKLPPLDLLGATVGSYVKIEEPRGSRRRG